MTNTNTATLKKETNEAKKARRKVFRDTVSGFTHMGGAVLAIVGAVFLLLQSTSVGDFVSYLIYCISMFLLFSASTTYHLVTRESVMRPFHKLDHAMIYVLIAGTYTPILYHSFAGSARFWFLFGIWAFALAGVIFKIFFTGRFRVISTALYIAMGWACIFSMNAVGKALGFWGTVILLFGGLCYTIGGVIYAIKWPGKNNKNFGFHEIFHIFVLLGAGAMYAAILAFL